MSKEKTAAENETAAKTWTDPECVELDIPGVTRVGGLDPSADGFTFFS